jgi:hypothetical protein
MRVREALLTGVSPVERALPDKSQTRLAELGSTLHQKPRNHCLCARLRQSDRREQQSLTINFGAGL